MSDPIENPEKRRRIIMIAIAVLVGALILLLVSERASIVEPTPAPATPAGG